ncbi:MAG TPA: TolC family protein [Spirochaetota bacterium]|nr:TolC family protein [Spirochaetota bacterium]HOM37653.1 TolC family protein [Spirochaetota bacterium]HPQ49611.1 TolC family protein [Spirochaetota bacterium]
MKRYLLLLILPVFLYSKPVKIDEFVKSYIENSYKIKQEKELLNQSLADIMRANAIDDIYLYGNTGYTYSKGGGKDSLIPTEKSNSYSLIAGLSKAFSDTGTRVKVDTSLVRVNSETGLSMYSAFIPQLAVFAGQEKTFYMNSIKFSVTQPLLKNFFGLVDRYPLEASKLGKDIREIMNEESFEKEITSAISLYLRWLFLSKQIKLVEEIINENRDVFKQAEEMVKSGISSKADLETARVGILMYERTLFEVKKAYETLVEEIKKYYNLSDDDYPAEIEVFDKSISNNYNIDNLRLVKLVDKYISQVSLSLSIAKNKRLPSLDLIGSYTLYGSADSLSKSYSNISTSEFFIGIQLSLPIFDFDVRGEIKKWESEYQRLQLEKEKTLKDINTLAISLFNSLNNTKIIIDKQREYIKSLEIKLGYQRDQYRQGILPLAEVVRTSSDLSNAKLALTNYIVEYQTTYYNYLDLIDKLSGDFF